MESDVCVETDFLQFFGKRKHIVMMDNPSEHRLGMVCNQMFTMLEMTAKHAGEYDYAIRMMNGTFGDPSRIRTLDYGDAGQFTGIRLHFLGCKEVVISDEDSMFLDFLKFLCEKYEVPIIFEAPDRVSAERDAFEYVICQRPVSQYGSPPSVLRSLRRMLTPAGMLYLGHSVNCHKSLTHDRYLGTMASNGFAECWDSPMGDWRGFQRIR